MKWVMNIWILSLFIFTANVFLPCDGTLSKSSPKKAKKEPERAEITEDVFKRGLVKEKIKVKELLANHHVPCKSCKSRKFKSGATLAYVTPWNGLGYDVAKRFTQKFTHISPVWLQLKMMKGLHLQVTGTHDIDDDWIKTLRTNNKKIKLVPRMLLDGWTGQDYVRVFSSEEALELVAKTIGEFLMKREFDGIVLETAWLGPNQRQDLNHLLTHIGDHLHSIHKQFILVIPPSPPSGAPPFGQTDFEVLKDSVDFFSLMTYDYPERPGPNAPFPWVEHCIKSLVPDDTSSHRNQILVGLNFYGYRYASGSADAILGSQLVEKLSNEKYKVSWLRDVMEHKFSKKGEDIFFPSLYSIEKRLELFRKMNTGVSVWEVGQGMNFFYDLL